MARKPKRKVAAKSTATKRTTGKTVTKARMAKEKVSPEYLVLTVPQSVKEGANFKLLQVTDSYEKAEEFINSMNGNAAKLLCIFEKKKFMQRQPIMTTSEVDRNLASAH